MRHLKNILSLIFHVSGQFFKSLKLYRFAPFLRKYSPMLHFKLGRVRLKEQNWEAALLSFEKAIKLDPQWAKCHYCLGYVLEKTKKWSEAARSYERAIRLDPQWAIWHFRLGYVLEKKKQWSAAAKAYEDSLYLDDAHLSRHCRLWLTCYVSGDSDKSLKLSYEYIKKNITSLNESEILKLKKTLLNFSKVNENYAFMVTTLKSISDGEASNYISLAMMAWLLAIPSIMIGALKNIESFKFDNDLLRRFKALCPRTTDSKIDVDLNAQRVVVVLDQRSDLRVVYDISKMCDAIICLVPKKIEHNFTGSNILQNISSHCIIQRIEDVVPIQTNEEIEIARYTDAVASFLIRGISNTIDDELINNTIDSLYEAFQLDAHYYLYNSIMNDLRTFSSIKSYNPDKIIFVTDNNFSNYGALNLLKKKICQARIAFIQASKSYQTDFVDVIKSLQSFDFVNDANWASEKEKLLNAITETNAPIFRTRGAAVAVMADFNPMYFRSKKIANSIVRSILKRSECIAIQRCPLPDNIKLQVDQLLEMKNDKTEKNLYICQGMNELRDKVNLINKGDWCYALQNLIYNQLDWGKLSSLAPSFFSLSVNSIKSHLSNYLKFNFLFTLLQSSFALKFFSKNSIHSLLLVGDTRTVPCRAFTKAAKKSGTKVFDYEFLLISNHPRYKKPISDFILISETYLSELYQRIFGISKDRFYIVGTHMISNRVNEAKCMDKYVERKAITMRHDRTFLIIFAAQPFWGLSVRALEACINACKQLPVHMIIKLHPSDSLSAKDKYQDFVCRMDAKDWVDLVIEGNLTSMILAADLVVTLYSNVGIEAAILDRNVLSIQLEQVPFPIDLADIGVAVKAQSVTELNKAIYELLYDGNLAKVCKKRRLEYIKKNAQLCSGSVEERIAKIITNIN
jgi:tetratricopeptide (TPR) repeat protein